MIIITVLSTVRKLVYLTAVSKCSIVALLAQLNGLCEGVLVLQTTCGVLQFKHSTRLLDTKEEQECYGSNEILHYVTTSRVSQ